MAKRIPKNAALAAAGAASAQVSDLEVLHPNRELTLGGVKVVVREYGNVEWLRALAVAEPLVAEIAVLIACDAVPTYERVLRVIAEHIDGLLPLILQSVDRDRAWLDSLKNAEVEVLLMAWWGANGHFFVQRAANRAAMDEQERLVLLAAAGSAGGASTPPSSPTATARASSASTPAAS